MLDIAARWYPFRRVVGVEISEELAADSHRVLAAQADRLGGTRVDVVHANARDWPTPDDATVLYLDFPFSGGTLVRVAESIAASLERRPRRLRVLYAAPKQASTLTASGHLHLVRTSRTRATSCCRGSTYTSRRRRPGTSRRPGAEMS